MYNSKETMNKNISELVEKINKLRKEGVKETDPQFIKAKVDLRTLIDKNKTQSYGIVPEIKDHSTILVKKGFLGNFDSILEIQKAFKENPALTYFTLGLLSGAGAAAWQIRSKKNEQ